MTTATVQELTFGTTDRSPIARDEVERRACVRAIGRCVAPQGRPGVVGFCLRGDRLRVMVVDRAGRVGFLRGALFRALRHARGRDLADPAARRLEQRSHIVGVLRHYLAGDERDPFPTASALATGSCLPDLVGARRVPGLRLVTAQMLPRLRQRDLFEMVRLRPVGMADAVTVRAVGAARLCAATAFALGVPTVAEGIGPSAVAGRRAIVAIAMDAGLTVQEVARALEVQPRSVRRLAGGPDAVDPRVEASVRLRLALEETVREQLVGPSHVA